MTSTTFLDRPSRGLSTVFAWQFRRGLPLTAVYSAVFVGICLFPPWHMVSDISFALGVDMLVFAVLLPALHFGGCFGRPQADFLHAMPVRRGAFYLGSLLASLASLWLPLIPGLGARALLCAPFSGWGEFVPMLVKLGILGAATLLFFTVAAVSSGTYFEYGFTALVLSAAWPLLVVYLFNMIYGYIPGFGSWSDKFLRRAGAPPVALALNYDESGIGWMILWMALFTVLLAGAGYLIYCRRASENLGTAGRCRGMELFLRTEVALAAVFFAGNGLCCTAYDHRLGPWGIPLTLGAMALTLAAAWAVTELIYRRSLKKLLDHWKPLAASAGITVLTLGLLSTGLGLDALGVDDVLGVSMSSMDGVVDPYENPWWVMEEGETVTECAGGLYPGVVSPENRQKALALCRTWIEMERASQFPYLPGRAAYPEDAAMGFGYWVDPGLYARYHLYFRHASRPTPESQALLEECRQLQREIFTSEEYVESLLPLNALDALSAIDREDSGWVVEYSTPAKDAQTQISEDFRNRLADALREDFSAGYFPTEKGIERHKGEVFRLCYARGKPFTATAGIYATMGDIGESAAGKRLALARYGGKPSTDSWIMFNVTPEMPATYRFLNGSLEG